jgi:exonuclease III
LKNNVQGGGVGIYIKKGIIYNKLPEKSIFIDQVFESLFIELSSPKTIVGSIYRPNSKDESLTVNEQILQFQDLLANLIDDLSTLSLPVYTLSDFNLDLLKNHDSDHVKKPTLTCSFLRDS